MRPYIPKFKKISPVVHEICVSENYPIFFTFFFFAPFYKSKFEPTKDTLLMVRFLSNLVHLLGTLWPIITKNSEMFKLNLWESWMIISLKNIQNP